MERFLLLSMLIIALSSTYSCSNGSKKHTTEFDNYQRNLATPVDTSLLNNITTNVRVYYFYSNRRCATCEAVEQVTRATINENFKGSVIFEAINRDSNNQNPLIEKYKITGQTLLIVNNNNITDMTSSAFLKAKTNPDKFKTELISAINAAKN